VHSPPPGFDVLASTAVPRWPRSRTGPGGWPGVQYHPEVVHTPSGQVVLEQFLYRTAGITPAWTMVNIVSDGVRDIRATVGGGAAICGLSGGVEFGVAAALVQRAIGDRLTCVFVDHGLLRKGEAEQVERDFVAATGRGAGGRRAQKRFLDALSGVSDPEGKRKIIGREVHPGLRASRP